MFYLKLPTFSPKQFMEMGEVSFGKFLDYGGLKMLRNFLDIIKNNGKLLLEIEIKDDAGKDYTPDEFLDFLMDLEIKEKQCLKILLY